MQYIAKIVHLLIASVRSHRCGGCEESFSGTVLYNTSSYMACIWLKATGQVVTELRLEHFTGSSIRGRFPEKIESATRCSTTETRCQYSRPNLIIKIRVSIHNLTPRLAGSELFALYIYCLFSTGRPTTSIRSNRFKGKKVVVR